MKRFAMCDTSHDFDGDLAVGDAAVAALTNHPADFSFVYFGHTDAVGHDHTWMSDEYLAAIGRADVQVGRVVDALSNGATVIVTADHGGHDRTHGTTMDEDMLVPIVIAGPSVTPHDRRAGKYPGHGADRGGGLRSQHARGMVRALVAGVSE